MTSFASAMELTSPNAAGRTSVPTPMSPPTAGAARKGTARAPSAAAQAMMAAFGGGGGGGGGGGKKGGKGGDKPEEKVVVSRLSLMTASEGGHKLAFKTVNVAGAAGGGAGMMQRVRMSGPAAQIRFSLREDQSFRRRWNWMRFVIVSLYIAMVPFRLCHTDNFEAFQISLLPELLMDLFMFIDIALRLFVFVHHDSMTGQQSETRREIVWHYTHSEVFKWDLIAAFPIDYIGFGVDTYRLLYVLRMFRLLHIRHVFNHFDDIVARQWRRSGLLSISGFRVIGKVLFFYFSITHTYACIWWLMIKWSPSEHVIEIAQTGESRIFRYVQGLYFTIVTMVNVGYGDFTPQNKWEIWVAVSMMVTGFLSTGTLVANYVPSLANSVAAENQFFSQMATMNAYIIQHGVPGAVQKRVIEYMHYIWKRQRGVDENEVLAQDMPTRYRIDVCLEIYGHILESVPFLWQCPSGLLRALVLKMRSTTYCPGDIILYQGQYNFHLHVVALGEVALLRERWHDVSQSTCIDFVIIRASYFGLDTFLHPDRQCESNAMVTESGYCDVFSLTRDDYEELAKPYPKYTYREVQLADLREKLRKREQQAAMQENQAYDRVRERALAADEFAPAQRTLAIPLVRAMTVEDVLQQSLLQSTRLKHQTEMDALIASTAHLDEEEDDSDSYSGSDDDDDLEYAAQKRRQLMRMGQLVKSSMNELRELQRNTFLAVVRAGNGHDQGSMDKADAEQAAAIIKREHTKNTIGHVTTGTNNTAQPSNTEHHDVHGGGPHWSWLYYFIPCRSYSDAPYGGAILFNSMFRRIWDALSLLGIIYYIVVIPLQVGFLNIQADRYTVDPCPNPFNADVIIRCSVKKPDGEYFPGADRNISVVDWTWLFLSWIVDFFFTYDIYLRLYHFADNIKSLADDTDDELKLEPKHFAMLDLIEKPRKGASAEQIENMAERAALIHSMAGVKSIRRNFGRSTVQRAKLQLTVDGVKLADGTGKAIRTVGQRYRRSWGFVLDLLAAFPLEILCGFGLLRTKWLYLARINRLLRLHQMNDNASRLEQELTERIHLGSLPLIKLAILACLFAHIVGSALYGLSYFLTNANYPITWIVQDVTGNLLDQAFSTQYLRSFYFIVVTTSTVGYGDQLARCMPEYVFIAFFIWLGLAFYLTLLANLTVIADANNASANAFQYKQQILQQFMKFRLMPNHVRNRVKDYYSHQIAIEKSEQESTLLGSLPPLLKIQLLSSVVGGMFFKLPLFDDFSDNLVDALTACLQPAVFAPSDVLCRIGERSSDTFFIQTGQVEVRMWVAGAMRVFQTLGADDSFGSDALLYDLPPERTATYICLTVCNLFVLKKGDFDDRLRLFPQDAYNMADKKRQLREMTEAAAAAVAAVNHHNHHHHPTNTSSGITVHPDLPQLLPGGIPIKSFRGTNSLSQPNNRLSMSNNMLASISNISVRRNASGVGAQVQPGSTVRTTQRRSGGHQRPNLGQIKRQTMESLAATETQFATQVKRRSGTGISPPTVEGRRRSAERSSASGTGIRVRPASAPPMKPRGSTPSRAGGPPTSDHTPPPAAPPSPPQIPAPIIESAATINAPLMSPGLASSSGSLERQPSTSLDADTLDLHLRPTSPTPEPHEYNHTTMDTAASEHSQLELLPRTDTLSVSGLSIVRSSIKRNSVVPSGIPIIDTTTGINSITAALRRRAGTAKIAHFDTDEESINKRGPPAFHTAEPLSPRSPKANVDTGPMTIQSAFGVDPSLVTGSVRKRMSAMVRRLSVAAAGDGTTVNKSAMLEAAGSTGFGEDYGLDELNATAAIVAQSKQHKEPCQRVSCMPKSNFRVIWDLLAAMAMVYYIVLVPIRICLHSPYVHNPTLDAGYAGDQKYIPPPDEILHWTIYMDTLIDLFFIADIVLRFRYFSYMEDGMLVTNPARISRHYLPTFPYDLLGTMMLDLFILALPSTANWTLYWLRLGRLLRLHRANEYITAVEEWLSEQNIIKNTVYLHIAQQFAFIAMLAHWFGCFWFLVGVSDPDELGWVSYTSYPVWNYPTDADNEVYMYMESLYYIVVTMSTVGYGDIKSGTVRETVFTLCLIFVGIFYYSSGTATIASMAANLDIAAGSFNHRLDEYKNFMHRRGLPLLLNKKIRDYFESLWRTHKGVEESATLTALPPPLRSEVSNFVYADMLTKMELFLELPAPFIRGLCSILEAKFFTAQTVFINKDEYSHMTYLIKVGVADAMEKTADTKSEPFVFYRFTANNVVGAENAFSEDAIRQTQDIVAFTDVETAVIEYEPLQELLSVYPHIANALQQRISELKRTSPFYLNQGNLNAVFMAGAEGAKKQSRKAVAMLDALGQQEKTRYKTRILKDEDWIVFPDHVFRQRWDMWALLCMAFYLVVIPGLIALSSSAKPFDHPISEDVFWPMCFLTWLLDVFFWFDFYFRIRRFGSLDSGLPMTTPDEITHAYFSSKFAAIKFTMDIVASFPFDLYALMYALATDSELVTLNTISYMRLLRVFSTLKIPTYLTSLEKVFERSKFNINFQVRMILQLGVVIFLAMHWVACIWFYLGSKPKITGFSWFEFSGKSAQLDASGYWGKYMYCFYWAITTLTTTGYGEISATNRHEVVFNAFIIVIGDIIYGAIIGSVSVNAAYTHERASRHERRINYLKQYMSYRKIPPRLARLTLQYQRYIYQATEGYDDVSLIKGLPVELQTQVGYALYGELLSAVPFFEKCSVAMISKLASTLKFTVYLAQEQVYRQGEFGDILYFLRQGEMKIHVGRDGAVEKEVTLQAPSLFGEVSFFTGMARSAGVRAHTNCDTLTLSKRAFDRVLRSYPQFKAPVMEAFLAGCMPDVRAKVAAKLYADTHRANIDAAAQASDSTIGTKTERPGGDGIQEATAAAIAARFAPRKSLTGSLLVGGKRTTLSGALITETVDEDDDDDDIGNDLNIDDEQEKDPEGNKTEKQAAILLRPWPRRVERHIPSARFVRTVKHAPLARIQSVMNALPENKPENLIKQLAKHMQLEAFGIETVDSSDDEQDDTDDERSAHDGIRGRYTQHDSSSEEDEVEKMLREENGILRPTRRYVDEESDEEPEQEIRPDTVMMALGGPGDYTAQLLKNVPSGRRNRVARSLHPVQALVPTIPRSSLHSTLPTHIRPSLYSAISAGLGHPAASSATQPRSPSNHSPLMSGHVSTELGNSSTTRSQTASPAKQLSDSPDTAIFALRSPTRGTSISFQPSGIVAATRTVAPITPASFPLLAGLPAFMLSSASRAPIGAISVIPSVAQLAAVPRNNNINMNTGAAAFLARYDNVLQQHWQADNTPSVRSPASVAARPSTASMPAPQHSGLPATLLSRPIWPTATSFENFHDDHHEQSQSDDTAISHPYPDTPDYASTVLDDTSSVYPPAVSSSTPRRTPFGIPRSALTGTSMVTSAPQIRSSPGTTRISTDASGSITPLSVLSHQVTQFAARTYPVLGLTPSRTTVPARSVLAASPRPVQSPAVSLVQPIALRQSATQLARMQMAVDIAAITTPTHHTTVNPTNTISAVQRTAISSAWRSPAISPPPSIHRRTDTVAPAAQRPLPSWQQQSQPAHTRTQTWTPASQHGSITNTQYNDPKIAGSIVDASASLQATSSIRMRSVSPTATGRLSITSPSAVTGGREHIHLLLASMTPARPIARNIHPAPQSQSPPPG